MKIELLFIDFKQTCEQRVEDKSVLDNDKTYSNICKWKNVANTKGTTNIFQKKK